MIIPDCTKVKWSALLEGTRVLIHSLQKRVDLNGQLGHVLGRAPGEKEIAYCSDADLITQYQQVRVVFEKM